MSKLLKSLVAAVVLAGSGSVLAEAEPAGPASAEAKPSEAKLVSLGTLEAAFAKALQTRTALIRFIQTEEVRLKELKGEEAEALSGKLDDARAALNQMITYMDVIFGLGGTRDYDYDQVKSTIYLRVGTVSEVFIRGVRARDAYASRAAELHERIAKETDAGKKEALQKEANAATQRWALMINALYKIYQVHPKRNYHFDERNMTLYLKATDAEVEKLKAEIAKSKNE